MHKTIAVQSIFIVILTGFFNWSFPQIEKDSAQNHWDSKWNLKFSIESNDNVFKFSDSQKNRFDGRTSVDEVNGRFKDMESISDVIFSIAPEYELKTKSGLFDRTFRISGKIYFNHYLNNTAKDYFRFRLSAEQEVSSRGEVRLKTYFKPAYFIKNYLFDATDTVGSVSGSERIYRKGIYDEWDVFLSYRHNARKWKINFTGELLLSYHNRSYTEEFPGRSRDGFGGGLKIGIEPVKWLSLNLGYFYEALNSPVTNEVLLLDEQDYQIDFNNDRDFADNNVRTVQPVDRSRNSDNFGIELIIKPIKHIELNAEYETGSRDYTSNQPIDPNYRDRHDTISRFKLEFIYSLAKHLFLEFSFNNITQNTNRPSDPESVGEIKDYTMNIVKVGVKWILN